MEGILQTVLRPIQLIKEKTALAAKDPLIEEIETVKEELKSVQNRFDLLTDFDLTDACIYEMEALEARYRFLLKEAKQRHMQNAPIYMMK